MILSNQLSDYVSAEHVTDLNHTLFPGRNWDELHKEIIALADGLVPHLYTRIKEYIDTLYVPRMTEPMIFDALPIDFPVFLAEKIDEYCPDWNIAQKTLFYWHYLRESWNKGNQDMNQRVLDRANKDAYDKAQGEGKAIEIEGPPDPALN